MFGKLLRHIVVFFIFCSLTGCVSTEKKRSQKVISQLQMQEDIQRFYTRFTERIVEAIHNDGIVTEYSQDALKEYTLYDSEALKIATSPFPTVNLLDMIVFIKLNKTVIKSYWIPKGLGAGEKLLVAFEESEKDISQISQKLLTQDELNEVDYLVQEWVRDNPTKFRVEKIRFANFSKFAKDLEHRKSFSLSKIFVNTDNVVNAADQMILMANRGIFLAQQMPFILRLQSRIGVQEVIQDSITSMQSAPKIIKEINETKPLVHDLITLASELDNLAKNSHGLLKTMQDSLTNGDVHRSLAQADSLLKSTTAFIQQAKLDKPPGYLKDELRGLIWFGGGVLILVGVCISVAWWTGYYVSKRLLNSINLIK